MPTIEELQDQITNLEQKLKAIDDFIYEGFPRRFKVSRGTDRHTRINLNANEYPAGTEVEVRVVTSTLPRRV